MIAGIPLAFAEPLILLGLLSLPILWWLLRMVPPRPRRIDFPPTRMLFDIIPKEETPARTPWWLTLLLLIDDGFAAAATWDARLRTTEDLIARADADGRGVALAPLSMATRDISL